MPNPAVTARQKLEISQINRAALQREGIGGEVDLDKFRVLVNRSAGFDLGSRILDANIRRTIEDSSTLTVAVDDSDRQVLRSGVLSFDQSVRQTTKSERSVKGNILLHNRLDIQIDGLWFRLNGVGKEGDRLDLVFIDREIAVLKTYDSKLIASRTHITRAQFVLRMIQEVKEFKIPVEIPELRVVRAIESSAQTPDWSFAIDKKSRGIPVKNDLTVKSANMSESQRQVANAILDVANNRAPKKPATRKVQVAAIMAAMQESGLANLSSGPITEGGAGIHRGAFQQDPRYWPASGDVATDAVAFVDRAMDWDISHPAGSITAMIEDVQGNHDGTYGQHRAEAERIVTMYGLPPRDSASANAMASFSGQGGDYHFFRGIPPLQGEKTWTKENSWDCIKRLAEEVNFRAFFVSGKFYYISDDRLLQSQPLMVIDEDSRGIHEINGEYMQYSDKATCSVPCDLGRWVAPPGSVVQIVNTGPFDGRWITSEVERSFYDTDGVITLVKNDPILPEPATDQIGAESSGIDWAGRLQQTDQAAADPSVAADLKSAKDAAKAILNLYYASGQYRDDNGTNLPQLRKIAAGQKLHSQCGEDVVMDPGVLNGLLALLAAGFQVGTFAFCEDHHCYSSMGPPPVKSQHSVGKAVDISSLGHPAELVSFGAIGNGDEGMTRLIKKAMVLLQPRAWDLFCNGNGSTMADVQALQKDNGRNVSGTIVGDHTNHIHFSVAPGGRD